MSGKRVSPVDFLESEVLPALFERLDSAFPAFGWKRTGRGWTATDREYTKGLTGARPGRVVCNAPRGFLVHGGDSTAWPAFVNGGTYPRGEDFVRVVKELAGLAGVDASPLERVLTPEERDRQERGERRRSVLEDFMAYAGASLHGPAGAAAREYLTKDRGFTAADLEDLPLGLYTKAEDVKDHLVHHGHALEEIRDAGLLPPAFTPEAASISKWAGRLVGELRSRRGTLENLWARSLDGAEPKYLYLAGAPKRDLVAFGLFDALRTEAGRRDLLLVEGVMDTVSLPLRGFPNVAAVGGDGHELNVERWKGLRALGVHRVTLLLDNDEAGHAGTLAAVQNGERTESAPEVFVVDPKLLGDSKDPDAFLRARGADALREVLRHAEPGSVYHAKALLEGVTPASPEKDRRDAVDAVLDLVNGLRGNRAALDRESVLRLAVERTGFSEAALEDVALGHEKLRRDEDARKALTDALRDAQEAAGRKPVLEVSRELSHRLARLDAAEDPEPPAFSVSRLWTETTKTRAGRSSGWKALDEMEVRFHAGELAVLAGRTGHAKTSSLVSMFWNFIRDAKDTDEVFVFYSCEEPEVRVFHRLLALSTVELNARTAWTRQEIRDFARDPLHPRDGRTWPSAPDFLNTAKDRLEKLRDRLLVVYRPAWNVERIADHALGLERRVGAVFADYLQRIPPPNAKADRRDIEVSAIARRLKSLAVELDAPVIVGAQINRESIPDKYAEKLSKAESYADALPTIRTARPDLHHIREGGAEQEADLVLGLLNYAADYRSEAKGRDVPRPTLLEVGTLKTREGEPGSWAGLAFDGRYGWLRDPDAREADALKVERLAPRGGKS